MKKMFVKYLLAVIAAAMICIIFINNYLTEEITEEYALREAKESISQMLSRMESNEQEIAEITDRLNQDYLTRCRSFRYIAELDNTVFTDSEKLKQIKDILNVDELHVIDRTGYIIATTVDEYMGYDMTSSIGSDEFLELFDAPYSELVQDIRPAGVSGAGCQYVGVSTSDCKYVLQVGMKPERTLQSLKKNDLSNFISNATDTDKDLFIIDMTTGRYEDHSDDSLVGGAVFSSDEEENLRMIREYADKYRSGGFENDMGKSRYIYVTEHNGKLIGVSYNTESIMQLLSASKIRIIIYVTLTFFIVFILIILLVDKRIVKHIHNITDVLDSISSGSLDKSVNDTSLPEFEKLSSGINRMKKSVISGGNKIAGIIGAMNVPIAVYELNFSTEECSVTGNIIKLFRLTDEEKKVITSDKKKLVEFVDSIMSNPEEGEEDVYRILDKNAWVKIESIPTDDQVFCVITDATDFIMEKHRIVSERDRDALTGIYNRRCFERKVSLLMEKKISGISAMLMIDLDNFKSINDNYGHAFGDEYLKFTANCLKTFEDDNVIVGRRSGDEFYMYLFDFGSKDDINKEIGAVYEFMSDTKIKTPNGDEERTVGFSAGAAVQSDNFGKFDDLLNAADEMLYKAKNEKKGSFIVL